MKQKKDSDFYILKRLAGYLKTKKAGLVFLFVTLLVENGCLTIAPMLFKNVTNLFQDFSDGNTELIMEKVVYLLVILACLYVIGNLAGWLDNVFSVKLTQEIILGLREEIQKKFNTFSISYLDSQPVGNLLSIYTNDMNTLSNALSGAIVKVMAQLITLTGVIIAMFSMDLRLTIVYIVMMAATYEAISLIRKKMKPLFKTQQQVLGQLNGYMNDILSNHQIVTCYGCEARVREKFDEQNDHFFRTYVRSRFVSGFVSPITKLISNLAYIALAVIGALMIMNGSLTIGEFMAFIIYANMISTPIATLAGNLNNVQLGMASAERIFKLIDVDDIEMDQASQSLEKVVEGRIEFENVSFRYVEDTPLMENVSFRIMPGETVAIVGPSGAGKTTVINLLMRFYDIKSGKISIDGMDVSQISRQELRQNFGLVLQDAWIFGGTIKDNIAFGKPDAKHAEIVDAAVACGCDSFIRRLPEGYDTRLDEEHNILSAGEKQLLTIARVYLANPSILILDEATSQVDITTEVMITKAMNKLMEHRTCFVIAHRLFTIRNADQIFYMENGNIREVGSHTQLMEKNGLYAAMYRAI